jgi:glyceraldehyde 3-phosphate dehydrogenase
MSRLLRYDSTLGPLRHDVTDRGTVIGVGDLKIAVSSERDPGRLAWREHGVQVVIESTGKLRSRETAGDT